MGCRHSVGGGLWKLVVTEAVGIHASQDEESTVVNQDKNLPRKPERETSIDKEIPDRLDFSSYVSCPPAWCWVFSGIKCD